MFFTQEIIHWYHQNKRELPWRHTREAYIIWLSEVILQQTRVEQGLPYFNRFVARYPDVRSFAEAEEGEILRLWEGLGYYSRARNMHKAAKMVIDRYNGIFPTRYADLLTLKGIGVYTAAAIASFAADEARPVVDGNVYRVLARYFAIDEPINSTEGKKVFAGLAEEVMDREHAAIYNQAIMEFGALQCKPQNPDCSQCPVQSGCEALRQKRVTSLPVKLKARKSRDRFFFYFLLREGDRIRMNKRASGDIWENLYELPLVETESALTVDELMAADEIKSLFGDQAKVTMASPVYKHLLSHQNLYTRFIQLTDFTVRSDKIFTWNSFFIKDLDTLAKPKLVLSFLREYVMNEEIT